MGCIIALCSLLATSKGSASSLIFCDSDHGTSLILGLYATAFVHIDHVAGMMPKNNLTTFQHLCTLMHETAKGKLEAVSWGDFDEDYYNNVADFLMEHYEFEWRGWIYQLEEHTKQKQPILASTALEFFNAT